jgi:hypothetical protein
VAFSRTPVRKRPGQRRIRVTLLESGVTRDAIGGRTAGVFTSFGTDDAAIDEVPFIVHSAEHGMLFVVTLPYRSDVVTKFETENKRIQIQGDGKTLMLLELENPERRNVELLLHCSKA